MTMQMHCPVDKQPISQPPPRLFLTTMQIHKFHGLLCFQQQLRTLHAISWRFVRTDYRACQHTHMLMYGEV